MKISILVPLFICGLSGVSAQIRGVTRPKNVQRSLVQEKVDEGKGDDAAKDAPMEMEMDAPMEAGAMMVGPKGEETMVPSEMASMMGTGASTMVGTSMGTLMGTEMMRQKDVEKGDGKEDEDKMDEPADEMGGKEEDMGMEDMGMDAMKEDGKMDKMDKTEAPTGMETMMVTGASTTDAPSEM